MAQPAKPLFTSQRELYEALKRRDNAAYDYLYDRIFGTFSYWVSRNSGSGEKDAEDMFQQGLLHFLLNLETGKYQLRENAKITTVIFKYCKNLWLNELTSARVRKAAVKPETYDPAADTDLQKDLERAETIKYVRQALQPDLENLPNALKPLKDDCRQLLELFYVDELSLKEIAEKMGLKANSAKQKRLDCAEKFKKIYLSLTPREIE